MSPCLLWSQLLSNSAINCIYGCSTRTHAHPYTQTHTHTQTHTPQSMITRQGFRVESWVLTYRCYTCICRSLGLVVERPQCASLFAGPRLLHATLRPHVYNGVQIQTLHVLLQRGYRVSLHLLSL